VSFTARAVAREEVSADHLAARQGESGLRAALFNPVFAEAVGSGICRLSSMMVFAGSMGRGRPRQRPGRSQPFSCSTSRATAMSCTCLQQLKVPFEWLTAVGKLDGQVALGGRTIERWDRPESPGTG
jgi:hypothetical protein